MIRNLFLLLTLICSLTCTKTTVIESNPEIEISNLPEITFISTTPLEVIQFQDSIAFTFEYIDGDGDLGDYDPDIHSIELVDNRDRDVLSFGFHLSPRTPEGTTLAVKGELTLVLDSVILLEEDSESETTNFSIRIKDRAGNFSNWITSDQVRIFSD